MDYEHRSSFTQLSPGRTPRYDLYLKLKGLDPSLTHVTPELCQGVMDHLRQSCSGIQVMTGCADGLVVTGNKEQFCSYRNEAKRFLLSLPAQ